MAKLRLEPGTILDGFTLEALVHKGGMARLWSVTKPGLDLPLLMKVPMMGEGSDPAAIVSFEMEQMIMPRLTGVHVPKFIARGDFSVQPYLVMERIPGRSLYWRLNELPLPYDEVARIGAQVARALDDIHRQHVIHLDVKPSNIMFRPTGEAVLLDFGLSHHMQLPDLMQEEFRLPYGTAPYIAPEQLLGVRNDPRSDQFALGVLLYFFSTGVRPFGTSETMRGMRRRLWRDPHPPRRLRSDYPPWLQEIVLRCLEVEAAWRYPSAAELASALSRPEEIKLTARSERLRRDSFLVALKRRFNPDIARRSSRALPAQGASNPVIAVAIDLSEEASRINETLRAAAARALMMMPGARIACINVLQQHYIALDTTLDEAGRNKHADRLVALRRWAEPLKLGDDRISYHVLEALDPAGAIVAYAERNEVDQILIGARQRSLRRALLGSVSAKVASEAGCTVTVVRPPRHQDFPESEGSQAEKRRAVS